MGSVWLQGCASVWPRGRARLPGGCEGQGEAVWWHAGMQCCWYGVKKLMNAVRSRAGWCHAGRALAAHLSGGRQATGSWDKLPKRGSEGKQLKLL